jgi:hypothetical protein
LSDIIGGENIMTRLDRFSSIVIVAILAATAGWAASAFTLRQHNVPAPGVSTVPVSNSVISQPDALIAPVMMESAASQPEQQSVAARTNLAKVSPVVAAPVEAPTSAVATRPRVVNRQNDSTQIARAETRASNRSAPPAYESRQERKSGMSKTTKTAIVIGGGAAMGATIGAIAGGKKGAAIGAIAGGGGGALYSWIKHKQNKPVF